MMTPADVERSYRIDRSWLSTWEFTFGLRDYTRSELRLTAETYDAALRELDDLFGDLLAALDDAGYLDDTIVVLTSDHGELLGEHHMLDHQYSLHEPVLRVPLVVLAPGRVAPGREAAPVTTLDLFPTLLGLLGVDDGEPTGAARDLLAPHSDRIRLAEDPASSTVGISHVLAAHPGWDPTPFRREQRALYQGPFKYLWGSDGRHALYDVLADPGENSDRSQAAPQRAAKLRAALDARVARLAPCTASAAPSGHSPEETELLRSLGYVDARPPADGTR
jgi:arylsulfatase A-like enzyme